MRETPPNCPPDNVYCVKQTCAELGTTKTTLAKCRRRGLITPLNPDNPRRFKYSGQSINECWQKYTTS